MKLPRPKEKEVQAAILDYLALRRAEAIRTNSGAVKVGQRFIRFNSRLGCSDILACYQGRFLALEVKRDSKAKASDHQGEFLESVRAAGGIGAVVSSVEDVMRILDQIDTRLEKCE